MTYNFYIVGTPADTYQQYPNDYTADRFRELLEGMLGSRLVIFRQLDIIYYLYTERMANDKFCGFGLVFNKMRVGNVQRLIDYLHQLISNDLQQEGALIKYTKHGELVFTSASLNDIEQTYQNLKVRIGDELEQFAADYQLETVDTVYNGTKTTTHTTYDKADSTVIAQLTQQYNTVIVDCQHDAFSGHVGQTILALRMQIEDLTDNNNALIEEVTTLERKKKQYYVVAVLGIIATALAVGALLLLGNLTSTKKELDDTKSDLTKKEQVVNNKNQTIESLQQDLENMTIENKELREQLDRTQEDLLEMTRKYEEYYEYWLYN